MSTYKTNRNKMFFYVGTMELMQKHSWDYSA